MPTLEFQCRHRYPSGFDLDLSFTATHRLTCLFGPSGSGKTSVLSIVAGMLRPQWAKVRVEDRILVDTDRRIMLPPARRKIGLVFQDALLFPHLSVEDNLRYGQRRRRIASGRAELTRVVDVLELGGLLRRYPPTVSGGERQRVALGRALLSEPNFLMMDEPLASLDEPLKDRVLTYLERIIAEWSIPTIFVTHNQAEVRRAAEWVVLVEKGRVIGSGPPAEALAQPGPLTWPNAAGPTNLLRVEQLVKCDNHWIAQIGDGRSLFLPPTIRPVTAPCFVQFRPSDVVVSIADVAGTSVRNHLRGRICQVLTVGAAVFAAVDVGQVLWAEITSSAAAELDIRPGKEVVCLVKAHSLALIT